MISRRQTREYLLQSLYARVYTSSFDRDIFDREFFSGDNTVDMDRPYLESMTELIVNREASLLGIIMTLAPRFDPETIPVMHILILMIALTEMIYWTDEAIPPSVSVNEAVELAKKFSDEQGKNFINGSLSTFLKDREKILLSVPLAPWKILA